MNFAASIGLALSANAAALLTGQDIATPQRIAPPPPPPIAIAAPSAPVKALSVNAVYSIGDPTPEEQLYVEFINRARANPQAEALLLANTRDPLVVPDLADVDLQLMVNQFAIYSPAQPLAINSLLTAAARGHTADMFTNVFQGHGGTDGSGPAERATAAGYLWQTIGENVYANAKSVFHGHAGFEVDWGDPNNPNTVGGMQVPPGHRNSIHNSAFREIGVGVTVGENQKGNSRVGPQVVSQELGAARNSQPFITGVAYYDLNGNSFYDPGEGIGGVNVAVSGTAASGISARSGGYAVPVSGNGTYTVTFSGNGFNPVTRTVTVANQLNQKLDFIPAYSAPIVQGSDTPATGRANAYSITAVGGASEYQWSVFEQVAARAEGAENGTANITINQTAGYDVIQNSVKKSGSSAFHLAHPSPARAQIVTLKPIYLVGSGASLTFQSRLGFAAPDEHARVQISLDSGASWTTIFNQDGNGLEENAFLPKQVGLSSFAGKQAIFRFNYDFLQGSFNPGTQPDDGWFFDDIQFTNVEEITNQQTATAANASFQFTPAHLGRFSLQARAKTGHEFLPWGPVKTVQAIEAASVVEIKVSRISRVGSEIQLVVDLLSGTPGTFSLESKTKLTDNWTVEASTVQNLSGTQFLIKANFGSAAARFYRIKAN